MKIDQSNPKVTNLLSLYPELNLNNKSDRTFIKRFISSNLPSDSAKCLNPNCNNFRSWVTGYGFTHCCSNACKTIMKTELQLLANDKRKTTCLVKYGSEYISQNKKIQEKIQQTCFQNHGVKNPSQSKTLQTYKRISRLNNNTFNDIIVSEVWDSKEFWETEFIINSRFNLSKCLDFFKCAQSTAHKQLKKLNIQTNSFYFSSIAENEIKEFLTDINYISGSRLIIKPYELDIFIPDKNIAIEYNGIYWHSYRGINSITSKKQKDFKYCKQRHVLKTELCKTKNIQLFHIFENEWNNPIKQNIWKSIINNALGRSIKIGARKCQLKMVPKKDIRPFLEENHLQGYGNSPIAYGLYLENELVSIMTFAKGAGRMDKNIDWELIRFCNKIGYSIIGGASRLLKAFQNDYSGSIKSYANRRWSDGNLYRQLGFKEISISPPNHFYWENRNPYELLPRQIFQKHKLEAKLPTYNKSFTAFENMINNKYNIIWDSGNYVFIK